MPPGRQLTTETATSEGVGIAIQLGQTLGGLAERVDGHHERLEALETALEALAVKSPAPAKSGLSGLSGSIEGMIGPKTIILAVCVAIGSLAAAGIIWKLDAGGLAALLKILIELRGGG